MKTNWINDMLQTLGINLDLPTTREDAQLRKSQNMLAKLTREKNDLESSLVNLKTLKKVNDTVSGLFIAFNFIRFSFLGIALAIGYNTISTAFLKGRQNLLKTKIGQWDQQILKLESNIEQQMFNVANEETKVGPSAKGAGGAKSAGTAKKYVDAEIIHEYPNQDQVKPEPQTYRRTDNQTKPSANTGTIKEAQVTFEMLDKLEGITQELEGFDHEIGILFQNVYQAALKTADFIRENPTLESRMYLFYNHVDTLHDWAENLLELERNDVYESLLVNVKTNARKALPVLQAKIDREYFKVVNPKIMDLEAEMEVMSKEQF
ncbi:MAG: hypothetical protein WAV55_08835 [Clostridiaceae bacterium]